MYVFPPQSLMDAFSSTNVPGETPLLPSLRGGYHHHKKHSDLLTVVIELSLAKLAFICLLHALAIQAGPRFRRQIDK